MRVETISIETSKTKRTGTRNLIVKNEKKFPENICVKGEQTSDLTLRKSSHGDRRDKQDIALRRSSLPFRGSTMTHAKWTTHRPHHSHITHQPAIHHAPYSKPRPGSTTPMFQEHLQQNKHTFRYLLNYNQWESLRFSENSLIHRLSLHLKSAPLDGCPLHVFSKIFLTTSSPIKRIAQNIPKRTSICKTISTYWFGYKNVLYYYNFESVRVSDIQWKFTESVNIAPLKKFNG